MKTKWNTEKYDLGIIIEKTSHKGTFKLEDESKIISVKPSCNCTNVSTAHNQKQFDFEYEADEVPKHLRDQGWFHVNKKIAVEVDNPTMNYRQQIYLYIHAEIRTKDYGKK